MFLCSINLCYRNYIHNLSLRKEYYFMSILYILGNGFDLAHGLPTSYKKFAEILKQNNPILFNELNDLYFDNNIELWKHFEEKLGRPTDRSIKNIQKFIQEKYVQSKDKTFLPLNTVLDLLDPNSINYELNESMKQMVRVANQKISQLSHKAKKYSFTLDDYFITFNYTSTLENLYGIQPNHILHVHNKLSSNYKNDDLIFGNTVNNVFSMPNLGNLIGNLVIENFKELDNTSININERRERYLNNNTDIKKIKESFVKHIQQLNTFFIKKTNVPLNNVIQFSNSIRNNISKICIIGHSLASVDMEYFEEIKINIPHVTWYVHYFNDMNDIEKNAIKLLGDSYTETIYEPDKCFIFSPK